MIYVGGYSLLLKKSYPNTHCPKVIMNEKKHKQIPIQLPWIARTLSDAKKIIKNKSSLGPWR
jgi:hypothetical protein